jgi:hypothetical protein
MKFSQLELGKQFKLIQPRQGHARNTVYERVDCSRMTGDARYGNARYVDPDLGDVYLRFDPDTDVRPIHITHPQRLNPAQSTESPLDFDSGGFGIGGLARYEERPVVPSERALKCYEKMAQRATRCRRCGQTDVFDGAMFTTLGGDICDDCAG